MALARYSIATTQRSRLEVELMLGVASKHDGGFWVLQDGHLVACLQIRQLRLFLVAADRRARGDRQRYGLIRRGLRPLGDRQLVSRQRGEAAAIHRDRVKTAALVGDDGVRMHWRSGCVCEWARPEAEESMPMREVRRAGRARGGRRGPRNTRGAAGHRAERSDGTRS